MTAGGGYELVLTSPARRALTGKLPEPVAAVVIEFITTALIREPCRAGKPLRDDLAGIWSARRGTYRVLYRIREDMREVIVLRVEHRRDAYRPL
jgi:mRNA interferase RelE/StbE